MFAIQLNKLKLDLADIRNNLQWQNEIRMSVRPQIGETPPYVFNNENLLAMQANAPDRLSWQLQDHRYTVTALYGNFEKFVDEIVGAYIEIIPRVWPNYKSLPEVVQKQYRIGISQILGKWGPDSIYSSLPEVTLAEGLVAGLKGDEYTLIPQAILTDSNNYRADVINKIFDRIGIPSAYSLISSRSEIKSFLANTLGNQHTSENYLNLLIESRNKAAHGETTQVASLHELINYIDFIALLCESIESCLRDRLILSGIATGLSAHVGNVVHKWRGNIVGVKAISNHSIGVGTSLYFEKNGQLTPRTIKEVKLNKVTLSTVQMEDKMEFSVSLDGPVESNSAIYIRLTI
jgi:hypothetical protein